MKKKQEIVNAIITIILIILVLLSWWWLVNSGTVRVTSNQTDSTYIKLQKDLATIDTKLDSVNKSKDSIRVVINNKEKEIKYVDKLYKEKYSTITNQSTSADLQLFSNILSENDARLSNSNDTPSVKSN